LGIPGSGTPFSAPKPGTEAGVDKQNTNSAQVRFTWQMSTTTKLAVYNDRLGKNRGAAMTAGLDPETASIVWNSPIYTTGSVKLTSTVSSKFLIEAGMSTNYERYNTLYQPGIEKVPFSAEWYTAVNKADTALGTSWNAGATQQGMYPDRFAASFSASYVTGAHNVKVGVQDAWGKYAQFRSSNGDLRANFNAGVPFRP
jgi:hypothetical protein